MDYIRIPGLTLRQIKELDNINIHTKEMGFGWRCNGLINAFNQLTIPGTPVNAINAVETLTISGVVTHGEILTISNPHGRIKGPHGADVYEFTSTGEVTALGNTPVDIAAYTTKSSGGLVIAIQPTAGDKITIDEKEYTFVPAGTANADGEIAIGVSVVDTQDAIIEAINGSDGFNVPHPLVEVTAFVENVSTVTAVIGGAIGDLITTTSDFTNASNKFNDTTLGSGADCSAANAVIALVAAINLLGTQEVFAANGLGDTVILTAMIAGAAGNEIELYITMLNGKFSTPEIPNPNLSGGVDGTVGFLNQTMIDETYMYRCIDDNPVSGKNWRRIALGEAY